MDAQFIVECQFISAGYNLKQWDLIKNVDALNFQPEHQVHKSPGTEFLSPISTTGRQLFSSLVLDPTSKTIAALIVSTQELYISTLIEGQGFKKILLNSPHCLAFLGLNDSFIAVGCDNGVFIVDTKIPKAIDFIRLPIMDNKIDSVLCIDSSFDIKQSNCIAFGTEFGKLFYFNCFDDKRNPEQIETSEMTSKILNLKFSPHNFSFIITTHSCGAIYIWDLKKKLIINTISSKTSIASTCIDFSPFRNDLLCIGRNDGLFSIFDYKKMSKVSQFTIPESNITGLFFVQNGINLILGDALGQIHIYNLQTFKASRAYRLHSSTLIGLVLKKSKFSIKESFTSTSAKNDVKKVFSESIVDNSLSFALPDSNSLIIDEKDIKTYPSWDQKNYSLIQPTLKSENLKPSSITYCYQDQNDSPVIISPLRLNTITKPTLASTCYNSKDLSTKMVKGFNENPFDKNDELHNLNNYQDNVNNLSTLIPDSTSIIVSSLEDKVGGKDQSNSHINEVSTSSQRSHRIFSSSENGALKQGLYDSSNIPDQIVATKYEPSHSIHISNTNNFEYNSLQSILDQHCTDIKDFFGQQIITLLSEITRNVTNQQLQINALHNKIDYLNNSLDKLNKTLSRNPHLL